MTTCTECKTTLSGHWHTTSFPVETLCCPCAKAAGYLKDGCSQDPLPVVAQVGLPGVGPNHAQAEMLLRGGGHLPKMTSPRRAPKDQLRMEMA